MGENRSYQWALLHFEAFTASRNTFLQRTLANGTQAFAINRLSSIDAATIAIDMLGKYGGVVQFRPKPRGFLS